jgi:YD repeat-containing protein
VSLEQLESRELLTSTPWAGTDLIIGDFDGDGNLDRLGSMATSTSGAEVWSIDTKSSSAANATEAWQVKRLVGTAGVLPLTADSIVGDFNGDRRDDILTRTETGSWYVIESHPSSAPDTYKGEFRINSWGSYLSADDGWGQTFVGDFNGDGRDDIAKFDDRDANNKQWWVRVSSGKEFNAPNVWAGQQSFSPTTGATVTGDFNGDGRDDILFKKAGSQSWAIAVSDGSRFNVFDSGIVTSVTWSNMGVGDFDGDGANDLLGWNQSIGRWETIHYSDHHGLSLDDTAWGNALGSIVQANGLHIGDVNRDGRDDLVAFDTGPNMWKAALSQETAAGTNTFAFTPASGDGTNDWHRWFANWDWGPSGTPYKFLNIDAPYQTFLDIFSDVYNTVELELYPGLMKGIEATAQTKAGNDWDQAALLVDRLEAAGFDADIAYGTVTADGAKVAEWIGTTNAAAAHKVIKGTLDAAATLLADDSVRFKHAWVRAIVPAGAGFEIVDVDPSWKFKNRQPGEIVDLTGESLGYTPLAGRSARGTFDEFGYLRHAGENQLPIEWYEDQVMKYLVEEDKNKSLADVAFDGPVIQNIYDTIPTGWNDELVIQSSPLVDVYENFAEIANDSGLAARFTHRATISLDREIISDARVSGIGGSVNLGMLPELLPTNSKYVNTQTASYQNWSGLDTTHGSVSRVSVNGSWVIELRGTQFAVIQISSGYSVTNDTRLRFNYESNGATNLQRIIGLDRNSTFNGSGEFASTIDTLYSPGSGVKEIDISIGSLYRQQTSSPASWIALGLQHPTAGTYVPTSTYARYSNFVLYEPGSTEVIDGGGTIRQVGAAQAEMEIDISEASGNQPFKLTKNSVLEFDFKSGSEGRLHAIGWDVDFDSTNDGGQLSKRYQLHGTGTQSGYITTFNDYSGTDWKPYSISIGAVLGSTQSVDLARLVFVTDASTNLNAESLFRNFRIREATTGAGGTHWSQPVSIPTSSLSSITVNYFKQENVPGITIDDTYRSRLLIDGNVIQEGTASEILQVGDNAKIRIQHLSPSEFGIAPPASFADKTYTRKAGEILAIGFDANQYSTEHIVRLQAGLNNALADGATVDDVDELLSYTSAKYWYELNRSHRTIDGLLRTVGGEQWVGSGIVTADPNLLTDSIPGLNGGTPVYSPEDLKHLQFPILPYNIGVDLPNTNHASYNIATGGVNDEAFQLGGYNASALENAILEEVVNSRSVSTIRGIVNTLRDSSSTGTWVFESVWDASSNKRRYFRRGLVTESSSTTTYAPAGGTEFTKEELETDDDAGLYSVHSDSVVEGIVSLLENPGSQERVVVLVPDQKSVVDSWSGSVYVAEFKNNEGSHGAYIIAPDGGTSTNGGFSGNSRKPENVILPPSTFVNQTYAGDPVNVANGNMFRDEVDFTFANPIVPLDFGRHYDTQNKLDVGFGVGWVHSFTGFIYEEDDPANSGDTDYVWLRGSGERHTFEDDDFDLPNTLFGDVEKNANGLTKFLDRSGTQYIFEPIAGGFTDSITGKQIFSRLVAIKDASGHQGVTISYDDTPTVKSTRVKEVHSLSTPSRYLQFVYDGSLKIEVNRYDGNASQPIDKWVYWLDDDFVGAGFSGSSPNRLTHVWHANQPSTAITAYRYYIDGPSSRKGLIREIVEPNGESHSYEYYANGRVFRVTDGAGNQQSFNYNLFRNLTEFTDENGNVETYIHQDNGLLVKQIHNDRSRVEFAWGPQSTGSTVQYEEFLMQSSTDERGGREVFGYSPSNASQRPGELYTSTSKDGIVSTFTYNAHPYISSVASVTESPSGGTALQTAQYTYDTNGHILTATDADGHVTKYEYYDGNAPAHQRGLRRSETLPKGISGTEAVVWEVLADEFEVTGDTLSVRLWKLDNGKTVVADAIRIDRMDENGVFTRIIDDDRTGADPNFRMSDTVGYFGTSNQSELRYDVDATIMGGWVAGERSATWVFTDLLPGIYRVSASWIYYTDRDPDTTYHLFDGLPGEASPTVTSKDQRFRPNDFRSYQTLFEYDTAGKPSKR